MHMRTSLVLNADQTAIQCEMASGRTLTIKGVKKVTCVVQRQAATTHSFTLQVCLSASGSLPAKIFVVLYEPSGVPQNFNQLMHKYTNLAVSYTKSGWMDKQVAKHWLEDFLLPMIQDDSCLIIDAWRGYKEMTELQCVQERNLKIVVLPEGTIPYLQPCDALFNRSFKHFLRTLADKIRWRQPQFILGKRENLLTIMDLSYNQFKAAKFKPLIHHCWYKTGFLSNHPAPYETPVKCCFHKDSTDNCYSCGNVSFMN